MYVLFFFVYVLLYRFLTGSLLRPLLIGLLLGVSDGLFKPLLAATHNALIAPMASFFYNLGTTVKLVAEPLAGVLQLALEPVGRLLRSCRLVEIHHHPLRHIWVRIVAPSRLASLRRIFTDFNLKPLHNFNSSNRDVSCRYQIEKVRLIRDGDEECSAQEHHELLGTEFSFSLSTPKNVRLCA